MSVGLALDVWPTFQKKFLGERVVKQSLQRPNTGGTSPVVHGSRIRRRIALLVFGLLVVTAAFWAYRVMAPLKRVADDREHSTYTFHFDGGTHFVRALSTGGAFPTRKDSGEDLHLSVTSSWTSEVPEKWRPAYPGAAYVVWTATVDCSSNRWTSLNHDTFGHVGQEPGYKVWTDYGAVKRTFEDTVWKGKVLVLKRLCEVDSQVAL